MNDMLPADIWGKLLLAIMPLPPDTEWPHIVPTDNAYVVNVVWADDIITLEYQFRYKEWICLEKTVNIT